MFINNSYPRKSYINETTINKIVTKINLGLELSTEEEYQILDYSITKCWETMEKYFNIEIKTNTLTNKCDYAQKILGTYLENGKIPISNIDGNIYLNSLLKENHKYATSDERFNELYPSKKGVSK